MSFHYAHYSCGSEACRFGPSGFCECSCERCVPLEREEKIVYDEGPVTKVQRWTAIVLVSLFVLALVVISLYSPK